MDERHCSDGYSGWTVQCEGQPSNRRNHSAKRRHNSSLWTRPRTRGRETLKRINLALCLIAAIALVGCKDPYGASAKASADITAGITAAMQTTAGLAQQKIISAPEAVNVLGYLEFANRGNEGFETCIGTAHSGGDKLGTYTACAQAFNTALNNPSELALIKVTNSAASQTITGLVNGLTTATAAIVSALGGA